MRLEELSRNRPDTATVFAEIDDAVADVDRLIAIFNALLRLSELETGARRAGFVSVDLAAVAAQAVELYEPMAEARAMALRYQGGGDAIVLGDPVMLAQSVANLIENALKFGHGGGEIIVTTGRVGDSIEMAVADNGPGISDAEKRKVTERFYRGDASRGTPGLGLGLSLAEAIARLHGGELMLGDNHPGLRATLRFSAGRWGSLRQINALRARSGSLGETFRALG